jgi:hypothetical protein
MYITEVYKAKKKRKRLLDAKEGCKIKIRKMDVVRPVKTEKVCKNGNVEN